MNAFDVRLTDSNKKCVMGESINLFHILHNILTAVGITYSGHGHACVIYSWSIAIDIKIVTKTLCGGVWQF